MEFLKEQIKHEEELLRLSWVTAVATVGGSIGLLLGDLTPLQVGLAGLGLLITLILITMILRQEKQIRILLAELKEHI